MNTCFSRAGGSQNRRVLSIGLTLVVALGMPCVAGSQKKGITDARQAIAMHAGLGRDGGPQERSVTVPKIVGFNRPTPSIAGEHDPAPQGAEQPKSIQSLDED